MTAKTRYPIALATSVAEEVIEELRKGCEKIVIAGSIRRQRPDVGDIELLVEPAPWGVFDFYLTKLLEEGILAKRPNAKGVYTFGPWNKLLVHVASGVPLDLFSTTQENWGMALVVRTGSAEFNIKVMTRLRALGLRGHAYGGITDAQGVEHPCPTEQDVFRWLQWGWIPPERRE